ncbi:MAG: hypothetical protein QM737_14440 [Ferruginibacter sp.]
MRKIKSLFVLVPTVIFSTIVYAQTNKKVTDYLHIPGPVIFENKSYNLSWTSHPSAGFYKQEYIQKGENPDRFNAMILFDVTTDNTDIKAVVASKIEEIKKMKVSNPLVNYNSFDNPKTGEYMIDFLLSANGPDGKTSVVERNVYRYKSFTDKSGNKGIMLFGVSTRSYGNDIDQFLVSLKSNKKDMVNAVAKFTLPEIAVSK